MSEAKETRILVKPTKDANENIYIVPTAYGYDKYYVSTLKGNQDNNMTVEKIEALNPRKKKTIKFPILINRIRYSDHFENKFSLMTELINMNGYRVAGKVDI